MYIFFDSFFLFCTIAGYPNVIAPTLQYTVDYSNNVTFYCKINSTPQHYEVYWLQHIHSNFTRKISSNTWTSSGSTLKIKEIRSSANYSCVAVNAVGQGQSSIITLTVLGGNSCMIHLLYKYLLSKNILGTKPTIPQYFNFCMKIFEISNQLQNETEKRFCFFFKLITYIYSIKYSEVSVQSNIIIQLSFLNPKTRRCPLPGPMWKQCSLLRQ